MEQNKKATKIEVEYTGKAATIFSIIEEAESPRLVLDEIGVIGTKVFKRCPDSCPICGNGVLTTLELIGVANRPLFWECTNCNALHCMEERKWIEHRIKKLDGCWTICQAWEMPDKDEFN